jgi:hypothetical protein
MEFNNTFKNIIYHDQVGFILRIQGFCDICQSINVIQNINRIKNKNHISISIDAERSSDKVQHPFRIKTLKTEREGLYLNILKAINDKTIPKIILGREKLKTFLLISGMRQDCILLLLLTTGCLKS